MMVLRILFVLALQCHPAGAVAASAAIVLPGETTGRQYVCPPCPHVDDLLDAKAHALPGTCPVCGMTLVERPAPALQVATIHRGAGAYSLRVGPDQTREIDVFYYRPRQMTEHAPVLIVLPGAGRNAWAYLDHWVQMAEEFGVLVLALHYPESRYPRFWNYNIAGMITDVVIDPSAQALVDYRIVTDQGQWLFADLDRVFDSAVRAVGLRTNRFDLFGHSAGGQFLHRFALFAPDGTRANRILAANPGWYTVPDAGERFPFGLGGVSMTQSQLRSAFARRLVLFLGGTDDENETRGDLVRSAQTNRQGRHRLERGQYFFGQSTRAAADMGMDFRWEQVVVPGVGHDAQGMSLAAAQYLYGHGE